MDSAQPQGTSSFEGLLGQARDLVSGRVAAAVAAMLDKSDESLGALISQTQNREAQQVLQEARKLLASKRSVLEREFQKSYLGEFRKRTGSLDAPALGDDETSGLQLVDEHELEETLKFKELATKVRRYCDEELAGLDQRVGVLLGDANLEADDNPFSPQAICEAYRQACKALETTVEVRRVLMKLFDDHVLDALRSIYKEVNGLLVQHGILPKIRYGVSKKAEDRAAPRSDKPKGAGQKDDDEDGDAPAGTDGAANVFAMLQQLLASGAGAALGIAPPASPQPGQVVLQGAELLGSLTRIQRGETTALPAGFAVPEGETANVLRELKTSGLGAGMAQMDAMTLDIVAMLFDQLFDDPGIPVALKGLVGRLQIPLLKVAIADKTFFSDKQHPARRTLDTFGEIAHRLPSEFDSSTALFVRLEAIVQHLLDTFKDDVAVFETTEQSLRAVVAEEDARVEAETRAIAEKAAQAEALAVAKTVAEDEVRARAQAHKLPGPILEFLVEHWMRHLLVVHAKHGAASEEWKDALDVMDQLIWSVEPKSTVEERRKLAAAVPGLVRRLTAGLQSLAVGDEVRNALFEQLMKLHTEILGGKGKSGAPAEPAASAPAAKAASLDFTAPVTVANPYGGGEVQVSGLDFTAGGKGAQAAAADPPEGLQMGKTWIEFRPKTEDAKPRALKLLFVPPKKTRYVFTDRKGKTFLELTRAELVRQLRSGEAVRLEGEPEEPLFDRIMGGLMGKLRTPAAPKPA